MGVVEAVKKKRIRKRVGAGSHRGRDGQATGFRQVETIRFFIKYVGYASEVTQADYVKLFS